MYYGPMYYGPNTHEPYRPFRNDRAVTPPTTDGHVLYHAPPFRKCVSALLSTYREKQVNLER